MTVDAPARTSGRAARTREALLSAGLRLFADRPVDAVAIDEIVALAGVAKGSFFNHFADKQSFASIIGTHIRIEIERRVDAANAGQRDPVRRLVGGMTVAAEFALSEHDKTRAMLGSMIHLAPSSHPLNDGLRADIMACADAGVLRPEAEEGGVLFWLATCHMMMVALSETPPDRNKAARTLRLMVTMGLIGLGIDEVTARGHAQAAAARLTGTQPGG